MKALVVAAGIVFWTLVLGIAWLAFFPGSDAGEPVAILQIEPGPAGDGGAGAEDSAETPDQGAASVPSEQPADTASAEAPAASGNNVNMPPGFAVAPGANPQAPMVQPPGPGQMMPPEATPAPDAGADDGRQGAADAGEQTASTAPSAQDAAPQASGNQQTGAVAPRRFPSPNSSRTRNTARCRKSLPTAVGQSMSMRGPRVTRPRVPRETPRASPSWSPA